VSYQLSKLVFVAVLVVILRGIIGQFFQNNIWHKIRKNELIWQNAPSINNLIVDHYQIFFEVEWSNLLWRDSRTNFATGDGHTLKHDFCSHRSWNIRLVISFLTNSATTLSV